MDREAGGGPAVNARVDILGVEVSAIDMNAAVAGISTWIGAGQREYVCVTGVHGVIESQRDPSLVEIHNRAGMVTPDGVPLVWCGRYAGAETMNRVYGPDLMLEVMDASVARGWRHFFYGAAPGVVDELSERLTGQFPGLNVVGTFSPPFRDLTETETLDVAARINAARPDIVWVGLSTPKQERWMARFRDLLDSPVLIGVGAAFDMHAGRLRQAPAGMQRAGLEWLFRVMMEPRRLWRRYLKIVPTFLWRVARRPPVLVKTPRSTSLPDITGTL
jgi:N-acetylglucosaminyldiphosphoundecaprenol N-acetyl-beta-D-mannosaminyltransferase